MKDKLTVIDAPCGPGKTFAMIKLFEHLSNNDNSREEGAVPCNICSITYRTWLAVKLTEDFGLTCYTKIPKCECTWINSICTQSFYNDMRNVFNIPSTAMHE